MNNPAFIFPPVEPEQLYAISKIVAEATDWKPALEKVIRLARPVFIFDNVVIYLLDEKLHTLEVVFAKATGRGKSKEADVSWGEALANQIVLEDQMVHQLPDNIQTDDRLRRPYTLGIPLRSGGRVLGAVIFIRFGSPVFTEENIQFGQFLAQQTALMIERQRLRTSYAELQSVYEMFQLQEDFISTLSHEIRNPLGFIKGYTTTLLRPNTSWDDSHQEEFLTIIDKETDRLQDLIENLLDSARLQSGHMKMDYQPVRIDVLVGDIAARAQLHHPMLTVIIEMPSQIAPIFGDARRLGQVFENLINNAVKYAPGSPVYAGLAEAPGGIQVTLRDEGPGIPEKYMTQLFQRFFRVPGNNIQIHGSGLGLFICKQIIDAHHGKISVASDVGQGTTFTIYLPADPANYPPDKPGYGGLL